MKQNEKGEAFGEGYDELCDTAAHGGVTYSEPTDLDRWRIGFDCAHAYDLTPHSFMVLRAASVPLREDDVYRSLEFVQSVLHRLAHQAQRAARAEKDARQ